MEKQYYVVLTRLAADNVPIAMCSDTKIGQLVMIDDPSRIAGLKVTLRPTAIR